MVRAKGPRGNAQETVARPCKCLTDKQIACSRGPGTGDAGVKPGHRDVSRPVRDRAGAESHGSDSRGRDAAPLTGVTKARRTGRIPAHPGRAAIQG